MIKYFKNGDKEQLKKVLKKVYKCENVEHMSDDELVFCYIAKTLDSIGNLFQLAESVEAELETKITRLEKRLKNIEKAVVHHNERLNNGFSK